MQKLRLQSSWKTLNHAVLPLALLILFPLGAWCVHWTVLYVLSTQGCASAGAMWAGRPQSPRLLLLLPDHRSHCYMVLPCFAGGSDLGAGEGRVCVCLCTPRKVQHEKLVAHGVSAVQAHVHGAQKIWQALNIGGIVGCQGETGMGRLLLLPQNSSTDTHRSCLRLFCIIYTSPVWGEQ